MLEIEQVALLVQQVVQHDEMRELVIDMVVLEADVHMNVSAFAVRA